jgi:hypothetical protein
VAASDQRRHGNGDVAPIRPPRAFRGASRRLVEYDLRLSTGEALLKAVQLAASLSVAEELLEWVELGDRPGRKDADAADVIWSTVQRYARTVRGARRQRSQHRPPPEAGSASSASPSASPAVDYARLEKVRVALVLDSRILVVTLDCSVVSDTPLEAGRTFEVCDDGKELVLQTARRAVEGVESAEDMVHVWGRVQCGSTGARDELHAAVDRALVLPRRAGGQSGNGPQGLATRERRASSVELASIAAPPPAPSGGVQMTPMDSTAAADGTPNVFGVGPAMPGRGADGRPLRRASGPGAEDSETVGGHAGRRQLELSAAVRRLKMGGTRRALDAKRSLRIIVANALPRGSSIRLIRSSLNDGFWREQPPNAISAGTATMFEADSGGSGDEIDKWQMGRDVRGSVLFGVSASPDGGGGGPAAHVPQVTLQFVNPAMSSPSYSIECSPGLRGTHDRGSGAHATVVFTVSDSSISGGGASSGGGAPSVGSSAASLRPSRDALASSTALPLPSLSHSAPSIGGPPPPSPFAAVGAAGAAGAAGAGRLFKAGSRRFLDAASSIGAGAPPLFARSASQAAAERAAAAARARRPAAVDASALAQLVELGFPRDRAADALRDAGGDIVHAVDLLTR